MRIRTRTAIVALSALLPLAATASGQDNDPRALAQSILDEGAELFSNKDAGALAATYAPDATIFLVGRKDGQYQVSTKQGREEIEQLYRDIFGNEGSVRAKNTVEFARFAGPDLLVIQGRFRPNEGEDEWPFVQVRGRKGDRWLMHSLRLFLVPAGR